MRLKCLGILNYYDHASKLAQEKYLTSLLPVPGVLYSADEWFGFDGSETFENVCKPLEVLSSYMRTAPDLGDMAMEFDIACPAELAGLLMSQVLPQEIPFCIPDGISTLKSAVEVCALFEDDLAGEEGEAGLSKPFELEISAGDMPEPPEIPMYLDILETFTNVENFDYMQEQSSTDLKVQLDIEPERVPCPLLGGEDFSIRKAVQKLEAASDMNQPKKIHEVVPTFELKIFNSVIDEEPHGGVLLYDEIGDLANSVIREDTQQGNEHLGDPVCLPDFDSSSFILKMYAPELTDVGSQCRLRGLYISTCHTLLEDVSGPQVSVSTCELPEVIEEPQSFTSFSCEILDTADVIKSSAVALEDLGSFSISQNFETLIVMPDLTLDHSLFRSLPVNFFSQDGEAHIAEDVLKALSLTRSLSPTSASDWLYLDWHPSQKGSCNNHACFSLQNRLKEEQLRLSAPLLLEDKNNFDVRLLFRLAENSPRTLKAHKVDCEDYAEELDVSIVASKDLVSKLSLRPQKFRCRGLKTVENNSNHSVLKTEGQVESSVMPRLPSTKPDQTSIAEVLKLVQQARRGCIRESFPKQNLEVDEAFTEEPDCVNKLEGQPPVPFETHDETGPTPASDRSLETTHCIQRIAPPLPASDSIQRTPTQVNIPGCSSSIIPTDLTLPSAQNLQPTPARSNPPLSFEERTNWREHGPHTILIVNILQPEGPILWERRSAFQNILRLENEDLQVVERELQLPVDLILSPSTCLVIYTQEKLKLRASDFNNPNSAAVLSCIIHTIIDCHLKSFSFSFQRCFMVFEGEPAFTTAILHNMQKLYGAAASFGMHFQCFMSGDCTFTDVLITQRIEGVRKLVKKPYDFPMSESLMDGEAFLTQFSSLNPLAAHAILSLSVPLATFISWSHEEQVSSLDGYDIPNRILKLFKSQCQNENLERPLDPGYVVGVPKPPCFPYFPPASEIGRHFNQEEVPPPNIPYFPPAAEVVSSELEAHWEYEPREEKDRQRACSPIQDNSYDVNHSFDEFSRDLQRTIPSEQPYWPLAPKPVSNLEEPALDAHFGRAYSPLGNSFEVDQIFEDLPSDSVRSIASHYPQWQPELGPAARHEPWGEESYSRAPYSVQGALQDWLQRRKRESQNMMKREPEVASHRGFSQDSRKPAFLLPTTLDDSPNWTLTRPAAAHPQMHSKHTESWSEPQVSLRKAGQTNLSALQQFRHQPKRSPAAPRSQQKSKRGHYAVALTRTTSESSTKSCKPLLISTHGDTRASKVLCYERIGADKQTQLVWGHQTTCPAVIQTKRVKPNTTYNM